MSVPVKKGQVYRNGPGSKFVKIASTGKKIFGHVRNGHTGRFPKETVEVSMKGLKLDEVRSGLAPYVRPDRQKKKASGGKKKKARK